MTIISTNKRENARHYFEYIHGDCLEKAGLIIPDGAYAIIRQGLDIKVGDLVHCSKCLGEIPGMIKQVKNIENGVITVGTAYHDPLRDFSFDAAEVYGVVTEVFSKLWHKRVYERSNENA